MNKKQLLHHLETQVYCRLKPCKYGVGVFAIRDIKKGTEPFPDLHYHASISYTKKELEHLHPEIKKMIHDYSGIIDNKYHISRVGFNTLQIEFFINHSEDPTLEYTQDGILIAKKDIKAGEELTTNYDHFNDPGTLHYKKF